LLSTDAGFATDANCGFWFTTPRRSFIGDVYTPGLWIRARRSLRAHRAENAIRAATGAASSFTGAIVRFSRARL
jgi:hypothetical protein